MYASAFSNGSQVSRGLFSINDDWLGYLLSWLDICSVGNLDIAMSCEEDRLIWLRCLRVMDANTIDEYRHSHSSLRWVTKRGIRASMIQISESKREEITTETFVGFECPTIVSIDLHDCQNIVAETMESLSKG